jgi:hypothetical protein
MDLSDFTFVDSLEQVAEPLKVGDFVRVKCCFFDKIYNRKAQIIDFDDLSNSGSYKDRWKLQMYKSKFEFDCTREGFIKWQSTNNKKENEDGR